MRPLSTTPTEEPSPHDAQLTRIHQRQHAVDLSIRSRLFLERAEGVVDSTKPRPPTHPRASPRQRIRAQSTSNLSSTSSPNRPWSARVVTHPARHPRSSGSLPGRCSPQCVKTVRDPAASQPSGHLSVSSAESDSVIHLWRSLRSRQLRKNPRVSSPPRTGSPRTTPRPVLKERTDDSQRTSAEEEEEEEDNPPAGEPQSGKSNRSTKSRRDSMDSTGIQPRQLLSLKDQEVARLMKIKRTRRPISLSASNTPRFVQLNDGSPRLKVGLTRTQGLSVD